MVIIADLAAFCSDLVTPRFVDSSCLLCYTIDVIADNDHACFMRPEQAFYKLLYIMVTKSATTSSTGGLVLALKRAFLLLAQKGGIASTFTGPL